MSKLLFGPIALWEVAPDAKVAQGAAPPPTPRRSAGARPPEEQAEPAALVVRGDAGAPPPPLRRPPAASLDFDLRVPGLAAHQYAYNAGMVRHMGHNVMLLRLETRGGRLGHDNQLAALTLGEDFTPRGGFTVLATPHIPHTLHTAEDPRAFEHMGRLMVVFNLSDNGQIGGPRHIHLGEVTALPTETGLAFEMRATWRLIYTTPERGVPPVEKNWSPFSFDQKVHFAYQTNPNLVIRLLDDPARHASGTTLYPVALPKLSDVRFSWQAGPCRGGTPAVYDALLDRFVTFFHSAHSDPAFVSPAGHASLTYLFGCLTFLPHPPFDVDHASELPLATPGLIRELLRGNEGYGKRILFVQGLIADADRFTLSYGRGDAHIGICHLSRHQVLAGLRPVRAQA